MDIKEHVQTVEWLKKRKTAHLIATKEIFVDGTINNEEVQLFQFFCEDIY